MGLLADESMSCDMRPKKRTQACTGCRQKKLKCEFSVRADPKTCDRCRTHGLDCQIMDKDSRKMTFEYVNDRIAVLEGTLEQLSEVVHGSLLSRDAWHRSIYMRQQIPLLLPPPAGSPPNTYPSVSHSNELPPIASVESPHNFKTQSYPRPILDLAVPPSHIPTSPIASTGPVLATTNNLLPANSSVLSAANTEASVETIRERPIKRARLDDSLPTVNLGLMADQDVDNCMDYFVTNVLRYLPVLILDYVPFPLDRSVSHRSPLLFVSILAVGSLYCPEYSSKHTACQQEFSRLVSFLRPSYFVPDRSGVLEDVLALVIAGAWLGGELGFKASLMASDAVGALLPADPDLLQTTADASSKMLCSLGLATYIIEQRLRIIHDKPLSATAGGHGYIRNRYLSTFLSLVCSTSKLNSLDAPGLKVIANIELCGIIMRYRDDLIDDTKRSERGKRKFRSNMSTKQSSDAENSNDNDDEYPQADSDNSSVQMDAAQHETSNLLKVCGVLGYWNNQLDKWLSEWMGKLTVHLRPSSWKPLFLTFQYAKLFLNLYVVQIFSVEEFLQHPDSLSKFLALAENAALDILELLIYDSDVQRLIRVGPVFYPTIFVTAAAFLLKLISIGSTINYELREQFLVTMVRDAYTSLLSLDGLPCFSTIKALGESLESVSQALDQRYPASHTTSVTSLKPDQEQAADTPGYHSIDRRIVNNFGMMDSFARSLPLFPDQHTNIPVQMASNGAGLVATPDLLSPPLEQSNTPQNVAPNQDYHLWMLTEQADFLIDAHSTNLLQSLH